jgi:excisionase family DNA binding protein
MEMIEAVRASYRSDWLTVEEIAQELKLSKSIVYQLIRNGELEAVDLVVGNEGGVHQKGHFRIRRSVLNQYLDAKRVKPLSHRPARPRLSRRSPNVKNHLGL